MKVQGMSPEPLESFALLLGKEESLMFLRLRQQLCRKYCLLGGGLKSPLGQIVL